MVFFSGGEENNILDAAKDAKTRLNSKDFRIWLTKRLLSATEIGHERAEKIFLFNGDNKIAGALLESIASSILGEIPVLLKFYSDILGGTKTQIKVDEYSCRLIEVIKLLEKKYDNSHCITARGIVDLKCTQLKNLFKGLVEQAKTL